MITVRETKYEKHTRPKCFWMDELRVGDAIMSGVMRNEGTIGTIHYMVLYSGYHKLEVRVRVNDYIGRFECSYDTPPTNKELLDIVYNFKDEMRRFF